MSRAITWRRTLLLTVLLLPAQAAAAELRPFVRLTGECVRLSDLFGGLGETPDRTLGPAPAPGGQIMVGMAQLAAIAREFGVAWRPASDADRVVLTRPGMALARDRVMTALRAALVGAGAAADARIEVPGPEPIMLPEGASPVLSVDAMRYDRETGRFTGMLTVLCDGMAPLTMRLSGTAVAMIGAAVLTHRVRAGDPLRDGDVAEAQVPAATLHGAAPLAIAETMGLALRREVRPGLALLASDLVRPQLVERGATVRMQLSGGGMELTAVGRALEPGGLGDRVRVLNPASRAVVLAEVTGDGAVRVDPSQPPVQPAAAGLPGLPTTALDLAYAP